ncbi:MAG: DUF4445 domain-containing protein [Lachnospiraceae bacterium]|nr:DUF4445 domain-containing protein [Lachnospiraceae bacterium]
MDAEKKQTAVTVMEDGKKILYKLRQGESLFEILKKEELSFSSHCGGKGICKRCRVRFLSGAVLPSAGDRAAFTPEELRQGFRLACLSKPMRDCEIELYVQKEKQINVLTDVKDVKDVTDVSVASVVSEVYGIQESQNQAGNGHGNGNGNEEDTLIAIDLGTTTIAMELRGLMTKRVYGTFCEINPQRAYGADVISRIQAAMEQEGRKKLQQLIRDSLEKGIQKLLTVAEEKGLRKPKEAYLSGNTPMRQLFMGHSVENLGIYPFLPENINRQETSLQGIKTILIPGISAFVGGDIAAGLYYVKKQGGFCKKAPELFIDLGTNGEMAIGNDSRILVTATAAGPAFEGGSGETIMGADLIACLDELKKQGILDETGLLQEPWFEEGIHIGKAVLKGKDVRGLQMAKAAVFAGICLLIDRYGIGIEELERVYLAGGFGYYLNVESAVSMGLIPIELGEKITAVGNTSLAGAFLYGKDCMESAKGEGKERDELEKLIEKCGKLNLAEEEQFQKLYIRSMSLKPLSYEELKKELEQEREAE